MATLKHHTPNSEDERTATIEKGARIGVEHGWLCIRKDTGWLMWSAKVDDMPDRGLLLADVLRLAYSNRVQPENPRAA